MKLYYTRHGKSLWNIERRLCGRTDIPLAEEGREQARILSEKAVGLGIDLIISSPLCRAKETAEIIAEAVGAPVITDERLIEMSYGSFEGSDFDGEEFQRMTKLFAFRFPGGESRLDTVYRVYSLLEDIKVRYRDKTVLLVAHGGISKVVNAYFEDMTNEEFSGYILPNCELKEYEL